MPFSSACQPPGAIGTPFAVAVASVLVPPPQLGVAGLRVHRRCRRGQRDLPVLVVHATGSGAAGRAGSAPGRTRRCRRVISTHCSGAKPRLASGPRLSTVTTEPLTATMRVSTEPFSRDHLNVAWRAAPPLVHLDAVELVFEPAIRRLRRGQAVPLPRGIVGTRRHLSRQDGQRQVVHDLAAGAPVGRLRRSALGHHPPHGLPPDGRVGLAQRDVLDARVVDRRDQPLPRLQPDLQPGRAPEPQLRQQGADRRQRTDQKGCACSRSWCPPRTAARRRSSGPVRSGCCRRPG